MKKILSILSCFSLILFMTLKVHAASQTEKTQDSFLPGKVENNPKINIQSVQLEVTRFVVMPPLPKDGQEASLVVTVHNMGSDPVSNVPWGIRSSDDQPISTGIWKSFPGNGSFVASAKWKAKAGTYKFIAAVDPNGTLKNLAPVNAQSRALSFQVLGKITADEHLNPQESSGLSQAWSAFSMERAIQSGNYYGFMNPLASFYPIFLPLGIEAAIQAEANQVCNDLNSLYEEIYGRDTNPNENKYWCTNAWQALILTDADMARDIYHHKEEYDKALEYVKPIQESYASVFGQNPTDDQLFHCLVVMKENNLDPNGMRVYMANQKTISEKTEQNKSAIAQAFQDILNRPPKSGEVSSWLVKLNGGKTLDDLRAALEKVKAEQEKNGDSIKKVYQSVLKRDPTPDELDKWTDLPLGPDSIKRALQKKAQKQ